jgi:hypothetical protein
MNGLGDISLAGGLFIAFERTRAMPFTMGKALKGRGVVTCLASRIFDCGISGFQSLSRSS